MWRYFWTFENKNPNNDNSSVDPLSFPNIIPKGFPHWEVTMNDMSNQMIQTGETASKMIAIGLGLEENSFTEKLKHSRHLLGPVGCDLSKYNKGTIFSGFHYDLNFLTLHAKSNYPLLYIWLRNGEKKRVKVPDGCVLIQAGKQLEYLTGGDCLAGFHEVIYPEDVYLIIQKLKEENKKIMNKADKHLFWRVSSTFFYQIRDDVVLKPFEKFSRQEMQRINYPPILTRDQVAAELMANNLIANVESSHINPL